jgi:hypothetical protein
LKIKPTIRLDKAGLGAETNVAEIGTDERTKKKIFNWNKAKQRYKLAEKTATSSVFNLDDDEND